MGNYRAVHHKWIFQITILRFCLQPLFFDWICLKQCRSAVFSPRILFDSWNGSICFRRSPQNLKQESEKTLQQMFKILATWSLKSDGTFISSLNFQDLPFLNQLSQEQVKYFRKPWILVNEKSFEIKKRMAYVYLAP